MSPDQRKDLDDKLLRLDARLNAMAIEMPNILHAMTELKAIARAAILTDNLADEKAAADAASKAQPEQPV